MDLRINKYIIERILRDTYIKNNSEVKQKLDKKREYLLLHPEETIPEEHSIVKWQSFLPPVVQFSVKKTLQNITKHYYNIYI